MITGNALIVKAAVILQPSELVYVMLVLPGATAVTKPVAEIFATVVLDDTHGLFMAGVPFPANCALVPTHEFNVPDIIGKAFTVIISCTGEAHCPAVGVNVYVVVVVLSNAGDHVPEYPFKEVVGNAFKGKPVHIGAMAENVGVLEFTTVNVSIVVQPFAFV